jgi:hypothetical protein
MYGARRLVSTLDTSFAKEWIRLIGLNAPDSSTLLISESVIAEHHLA